LKLKEKSQPKKKAPKKPNNNITARKLYKCEEEVNEASEGMEVENVVLKMIDGRLHYKLKDLYITLQRKSIKKEYEEFVCCKDTKCDKKLQYYSQSKEFKFLGEFSHECNKVKALLEK